MCSPFWLIPMFLLFDPKPIGEGTKSVVFMHLGIKGYVS